MHLLNEAMMVAVEFRKQVKTYRDEWYFPNMEIGPENWFFDVWQPENVKNIETRAHTGQCNVLGEGKAKAWVLDADEEWHGFTGVDENYMTLDPVKVTLLCPGVRVDGSMDPFGIPAALVSAFLIRNGVVDEKTGFYNLLFLFSIGVNKSKTSMLLSKLVEFRKRFDANCTVAEMLPDLVEAYPERYANVSMQDLAAEMHAFLSEGEASELQMRAYDNLPEQVLSPTEAYKHIVKANTKEVFLDDIAGEVILTMLAPYPPGIPVVMPGERLGEETQSIIDFLKLLEAFDNRFPGFENDVHGAEARIVDGKRRYAINCIKE